MFVQGSNFICKKCCRQIRQKLKYVIFCYEVICVFGNDSACDSCPGFGSVCSTDTIVKVLVTEKWKQVMNEVA